LDATGDGFALPFKELEGIRLLALVLLIVPFAYLLLEKHLRHLFPDAADEENESAQGRQYYIGYTVGRQALKAADLDDLVRQLRREQLVFQVQRDSGGEKVFIARHLPTIKDGDHDLEAGVLSGGLHRATGTRFEVEEERCAARGDGYCRFVAIRG
jgi:predicted hydrocarbon binding protein